ncbi:hypothetical protein [Flavobacterium sp. RS13.1]|uniref:hypothetical protein n=1 Tax=Flavobacterium sp. RS13.1 TaxID=3400345 RepID=UPI003AACE1D0
MKKNTLKILNYSYMLLVFLIYSCSTEETVSNQTLEAQTWFKKYEAESPNFYLFQNLEYNWNSAKLISLEDGNQTIIVPVIGLKKSQSEIWEQKLYIYNQGTNNYKALIFEIYPDKNASLAQQSIEGKDFSGFISTWDLKTGLLRAAEFKNNQVVQSGGITIKSKTTGKMQNLTPPCFDLEGNCGGGGDSDPVPLREVIITNNNSNSNGSGNSGYENLSFSGGGSAYNGNSTNSFVTYGGGGGSNNGNNSSNTENCGKGYIKKLGKCVSVASLIEDRIKDSLDPCPKAVLEELKNGSADITQILKDLGVSETITINMKSDSKISRPAQSRKVNGSTNNYNLFISSDYTSATALFRASNILHEIAHCYFFSLIDQQTITNNPNVLNDFPYLYQAYCDKNYPPTGSQSANAHHNEMAEKYVKTIGAALQEFQTGIPVPANQEPLQAYTDLAWGGLQEAPVFAEKFPVGSADYLRIKGRYEAESRVNTTVNGQTTIGKPCN